MYSIRVDAAQNLVEVTLKGMISVEEVGAYVTDLRREFIAHKLRSYGMVVDITDCPIQSQDMLTAVASHMGSMPKARAIAIVTGSSLARMQVRRLFTQDYARIVATLDDGRAWVLSGIEPPVDRPATTAPRVA